MGTTARVAEAPAKDQVEPGRLAEEQAALRRVATLVAQGAPSRDVFAAVAQEVAQVLQLANAAVCRYDDEGTAMTILAVCGERPGTFSPGSRWPLDGPSMSAEVLRTGRPARVEDYADLHGSLAAEARVHGFNRVAGAPIIVDGRVWGVISTSSPDAPLPDDLEDRLGAFTELVATAIANAGSREELTRLADEQAALRRVATLVAQGASPAEVFEAVSAEVGRLVGADAASLIRFESDRTVTAMSGWTRIGAALPVGMRVPLTEGMVAWQVSETRGPARVSNYADVPGPGPATARELGWRSSVAAPVIVGGYLWGMATVGSKSAEPLPLDTEERLGQFTELVATAIANTESREGLTRLADEQSALRRVATLVACGVPATEILAAVAVEVHQLLGADWAGVHRLGPDGVVTVLASHGDVARDIPIGAQMMLDDESVVASVLRTGRSDRTEGYEDVPGPWAARARELGIRAAVGAPITVEGRPWGVMIATWSRQGLSPASDAEGRMANFTELAGTAIANAESRAQLDSSRARIVATADATRRRIERDLHDGAQQQLVSLALELRAAQAAVPPELREHRAELSHVAEGLTSVLDGLREIALGIHPAILAEGGLGPALKTLAHRSPIPVKLDVRVEGRLPEPVEVAAYYVVSEALTNAAKHARASMVQVSVDVPAGRLLRIAVRDDGLGGADPARGSGLLGLKDRAEAIGGTVILESCHGEGTSLTAELPLDDQTH